MLSDLPNCWAVTVHLGCCLPAGTSYAEFIRMAHLPAQLAEVDPIVASFCGGEVGVLSTLMLVEANNSKVQHANRCIYCGVSALQSCSIAYILDGELSGLVKTGAITATGCGMLGMKVHAK